MRTTIAVAFIGVTVIAIGAWVLYPKEKSEEQAAGTIPSFYVAIPGSTDADVVVPVGGELYRNERYGFSIVLPHAFEVSERDEGGGARTISFSSDQQEFQIYVLPYREGQITSSRIAKDTRNSATQPQEVLLGDGVRALIFTSSDPFFGELREVWFLHEGYLFEVTTYLELDEWLAGTMRTWHFF